MSRILLVGLSACLFAGAVPGQEVDYPVRHLEIESYWRLEPIRDRFDASGLERSPEGDLLVVRDKELAIYGVRLTPGSDVGVLYPHPRYRIPDPLPEGIGNHRFDVEGLAFDAEGTLHVSEESERRVLQVLPGPRLRSLPLDFSQAVRFFSPRDRNASLEGIAISGGRLFLANERSQGRLLEFDLETGVMIRSFLCKPRGSLWPDPHYSGLDWHDGSLYVLMRDEWMVVELRPPNMSIVRVIGYRDVEMAEQHRYRAAYPLSGAMEGILVEDEAIWLLTDNNGRGRVAAPGDRRPTLFRCRIRHDDP